MPSETRRLELEGGGELLQVCQSLHMHNTGASDPMPSSEYRRYLHTLEHASSCWDKPSTKSALYDTAVLMLIRATIEECHRRNGQ